MSVTDPPKAILSEMNLNRIDCLLDCARVKDLQLPSSETFRKMILNPCSVPDQWKDLKMLGPIGELYPAHLPQLSDCQFLPKALKALLFRGMKDLDLRNSHNLIPEIWVRIVDPLPFILQKREVLLLNWIHVDIEAMGFSDALKMIQRQKVERQIQLEVKWKQGEALEEGNKVRCSLVPKILSLFFPHQGKEIQLEKEGLGKKVFAASQLPPSRC